MKNQVKCPTCGESAEKFKYEFSNSKKNFKAYQCASCSAIFFKDKNVGAIVAEKYKTKV